MSPAEEEEEGGGGVDRFIRNTKRLTFPSVSAPARLIQRVSWQTLGVTLVPLRTDW